MQTLCASWELNKSLSADGTVLFIPHKNSEILAALSLEVYLYYFFFPQIAWLPKGFKKNHCPYDIIFVVFILTKSFHQKSRNEFRFLVSHQNLSLLMVFFFNQSLKESAAVIHNVWHNTGNMICFQSVRFGFSFSFSLELPALSKCVELCCFTSVLLRVLSNSIRKDKKTNNILNCKLNQSNPIRWSKKQPKNP